MYHFGVRFWKTPDINFKVQLLLYLIKYSLINFLYMIITTKIHLYILPVQFL